MQLEGKNAIVTGASRGIGRACAQALAGEGAIVMASDVLDCHETIEYITSNGGQARQCLCDVAQEADVEKLFRQSVRDHGPLDILVHCAGVIHEKPLLETTVAEFDHVLSINLRGSFLAGREALREMSEDGAGRVVMIASDLAYYGRESFSPYVASKHGVMGLVKSWALEFAPHINVNGICPGPIDTKMLDAENMSPQWRQKELDIPLQRFGQPEDVARLAVFLSGKGGDYITGQGLGINGGSVMI